MSTRWAAVGALADGWWRGFAMNGAEVADEHRAGTRDEVIAALEAGALRVVEIGGGAARVPAPVLPEAGLMIGGLDQDAPRDRLPGWARLGILGFLAMRQHWDGIVCVVMEKASFWVQVSADEVVSFQGFMTPRLIAVLGGGAEIDERALSESLSRPERLAALLRSAEVAGDAGATTASLIGAELAASRPYWLGQAVGVIADAGPYPGAVAAQGMTPECEAWNSVLHRGLSAAAIRFGLD